MVPRVTFLRGLAGGVPSGECELCLDCIAEMSGRTTGLVAVGRMLPLAREAHDSKRHLERYIGTLRRYTIFDAQKLVRERDNVGKKTAKFQELPGTYYWMQQKEEQENKRRSLLRGNWRGFLFTWS